MREIVIQPLTRGNFAPFGDVIDFERGPDFEINGGRCARYDHLAQPEIAQGQLSISLARAQPGHLPLKLEMMERHPLASQAFMPLTPATFLVIVAPDTGSGPGTPMAMSTKPGQGVNYRANTWHAVLTPLGDITDFLIIDRHGQSGNLEEHFFTDPYLITRS